MCRKSFDIFWSLAHDDNLAVDLWSLEPQKLRGCFYNQLFQKPGLHLFSFVTASMQFVNFFRHVVWSIPYFAWREQLLDQITLRRYAPNTFLMPEQRVPIILHSWRIPMIGALLGRLPAQAALLNGTLVTLQSGCLTAQGGAAQHELHHEDDYEFDVHPLSLHGAL
jgi:hypothetical protein